MASVKVRMRADKLHEGDQRLPIKRNHHVIVATSKFKPYTLSVERLVLKVRNGLQVIFQEAGNLMPMPQRTSVVNAGLIARLDYS